MCEIGYDQREPILEYAKELGLDKNMQFYKDWANLDRGFVLINNG